MGEERVVSSEEVFEHLPVLCLILCPVVHEQVAGTVSAQEPPALPCQAVDVLGSSLYVAAADGDRLLCRIAVCKV